LVDAPVADVAQVVVDDDVVALAPQHREVRVGRGLRDQRAVRGGDELHVREPAGEKRHQLPLPLRVQVQVDFVYQHDGRFVQRVRAVRVSLRHAVREVRDPRDERLVAVPELAQRHPTVGRFKLHARLRVRPGARDRAQVRHFPFGHDGKQQRLRVVEALFRVFGIGLRRGVIELEQPLFGVAQFGAIREQRRNGIVRFGFAQSRVPDAPPGTVGDARKA
jgi:hypothetical protein